MAAIASRLIRVSSMLALLMPLGCDGGGEGREAPVDAGGDVGDTSPGAVEEVGEATDAPLQSDDQNDASPIQVTVTHQPPHPADLLFLRLRGDGLGEAVDVEGMLREAPLWVDIDDGPGDDFPFILTLRDAAGAAVYTHSLREPIQIREWVQAFGFDELGLDLFTLLPQLGDFAVLVPRLPEAKSVVFHRREADGSMTDLGEAVLADMPEIAPFDAEWTQIYGDAAPEEALDVAILGDGYTAAELEQFALQAEALVSGFLEEEPYASYAERLNFYRVDVVSRESGASYDCAADEERPGCRDAFRDTAFGSLFPIRLATLADIEAIDYVLLQMRQWEVFRAAGLVPFDTVVVLVNTTKLGAFGLWVTSINGPGEDTHDGVVHEFGHAFGLLADEYVKDGDVCQRFELVPDFPNINPQAESAEDVKWSAWLTDGVPLPTPADDENWAEAVGLFRGAGGGCGDMYRPVNRCLMRSWGSHLCPVCAEQVVRRLYETFDLLGPQGIVVEDGGLRADVDPGVAVVGEWVVDGEVAGGAEEPLVLSQPGEYEVELRVREDTRWVRTGVEDLTERARAAVRVAP